MNIALRPLLTVIVVVMVSCSRQASITLVPQQEDSVASRRMASLEKSMGHGQRCDWKYDLPDGMKMELVVEGNGNGHWHTENTFVFPAEGTGPSRGLISLEYSFKFQADAHLASSSLQTEIRLPWQTWANTFYPWVEAPRTNRAWEFAPATIDPEKLGDVQPLWTLSMMVDGKYQPMERATLRLSKK